MNFISVYLRRKHLNVYMHLLLYYGIIVVFCGLITRTSRKNKIDSARIWGSKWILSHVGMSMHACALDLQKLGVRLQEVKFHKIMATK